MDTLQRQTQRVYAITSRRQQADDNKQTTTSRRQQADVDETEVRNKLCTCKLELQIRGGREAFIMSE